jgi:hypothetical protein
LEDDPQIEQALQEIFDYFCQQFAEKAPLLKLHKHNKLTLRGYNAFVTQMGI